MLALGTAARIHSPFATNNLLLIRKVLTSSYKAYMYVMLLLVKYFS